MKRWVWMPLLIALLGHGASPAYAAKYTINRHEDTTHYGNAATILVPSSARVELIKVGTVVAHRTDWQAIAEIGYQWDAGGKRSAFLVWGQYGSYNERALPEVSAGSSHRYWVGYDSNTRKYVYWMDDPSKPVWTQTISNMSSCKACLNSERQGSATNGDNLNCFSNIKDRYANGTWNAWSGSVGCSDNDPYYDFRRVSTAHWDTAHI